VGAGATGTPPLHITAAFAFDVIQDVSYGHITRHKASGFFRSEKQFLTLHATNDAQFSFRFKPVAGVAAVDVARLKARLDEALAKIQDSVAKKQQQQSALHHRISLPPLPSQSLTPAPGPSSTLPPQHALPLAPAPSRVQYSLVFAPVRPLPRCNCACACHCIPPPPFSPSPPPHRNLIDTLLPPSPPPSQAHASCSTCVPPSSSLSTLLPQPKRPF
jgi:hypothetical protein